MDEQYYCLTLDDYSAPSFTSFGKAYYGTLPQIKAFIDGLEADEKQRESKAALIAAFREYEAGNHEVTHPVAYQKIPLLEPVKLCGTLTQRLDNYQWEHLNTWRWPYKMRCDAVESQHFWFVADGYYVRCVTALFDNLCYQGFRDEWSPLDGAFWGFPHIIEVSGTLASNTLLVEEKRFTRRKDLMADKDEFTTKRDVDFTQFCNDIFGDG